MNGQEHIPADLLDTLLNVNSIEQAENIVQQYLPEEGEVFDLGQKRHFKTSFANIFILWAETRWG